MDCLLPWCIELALCSTWLCLTRRSSPGRRRCLTLTEEELTEAAHSFHQTPPSATSPTRLQYSRSTNYTTTTTTTTFVVWPCFTVNLGQPVFPRGRSCRILVPVLYPMEFHWEKTHVKFSMETSLDFVWNTPRNFHATCGKTYENCMETPRDSMWNNPWNFHGTRGKNTRKLHRDSIGFHAKYSVKFLGHVGKTYENSMHWH